LEAGLKRCRNKEHYHKQGEKIMGKVKEFYEALAKDEAMQERVKGLKAAGETTAEAATEAVIAFAKSEGYAFTAGELKDFSKELSDEDLAAVAGGSYCGSYAVAVGNDNCVGPALEEELRTCGVLGRMNYGLWQYGNSCRGVGRDAR
jgi:predicted ribosomally synthesized peptide with nif11-like leader